MTSAEPGVGSAVSAPPLLQMRGITKTFFGVPVLEDVDLDAVAGEVHAVVGENGAGKSTLMKILAGAHQPDAGTILLNGEEVRFGHPREAQERGVSIIYQEFNLLPERTVAQNIFLGREPKRGPIVDGKAMEEATAALLAELGVERSISPSSLVRDLSVAQQQTVEIAKALSFEARILVMDEPTAALSPHEVDFLFERVRLLQSRGLAVLYITHRLKEVFELAQRITVLKDGHKVDTVASNAVRPGELVRMMVGREMDHYFPPRATSDEIGEVRLRVRDGAVDRLHGIDLAVRAGEIVGLAGLAGAGRTEVARALFGVEPFVSGVVELDGKPIRIRSPRQAIRAGIGFLTEDRKAEGLILPQSVRDNALLAVRSLGRIGPNGRASTGMRSVVDLARQVELRAASLEQEVRYLSGGNQQKVVLAKWLATRARILIFDEPTRGIDVGAKAGIHELMRELARGGAAVVMISSELPEVIGMSDRILIMRDGTIAGELRAGASEAEIMLLATGEREAVAAA
ncbi:MAG: sugar ABC transporter ATP-binding protein [Thermomicrobiales bacterium]